MGMADTPLSIITLHSEVTRLRAALDDVAHAHERDLMRLARALGFEHEPPASADELVAAAEGLRAALDGLASPPPDEVIRAVYRDDGLCVVGGDTAGVLPMNAVEVALEIARRHRERPSNRWQWTAIGSDARPRAWPVVEVTS